MTDYFYPNACYICKKYGNNVRLQICSGCQMISYCNSLHRMQHWPLHEQLCEAIQHVRKNKNLQRTNCKLTVSEWIKKRMNLMTAVVTMIKRPLKMYELQMFMFPKSCLICYRECDIMYNCSNCPDVNICLEHVNNSLHNYCCSLFKQAFKLDTMNEKSLNRFLNMDYLQDFFSHSLPANMKIFIHNFVLPYYPEVVSTDLKQLIMALHSDFICQPMTLLFAMEKLNYTLTKRHLIIHVIAANVVEITYWKSWHILFHLMPYLKSVTIVMIDFQLKRQFIDANNNIPLCLLCQSEQKQLFFEVISVSYQEYIRDKDFQRPDFITGFDWNLYKTISTNVNNITIWTKSIQAIFAQNCPFILSSDERQLILKEIGTINNAMSRNVPCNFYGINQFASLRPNRRIIPGSVNFRNEILIIYDKLTQM